MKFTDNHFLCLPETSKKIEIQPDLMFYKNIFKAKPKFPTKPLLLSFHFVSMSSHDFLCELFKYFTLQVTETAPKPATPACTAAWNFN